MVYDYAFRCDDGALWTERAYGHYIEALAPDLEHILAVAPLAPTSRPSLDYRLQAANIQLAPLPFFARWIRSIPAVLRLPVVLICRRADWDVIYLRLPCPLALSAYPVARLLRRPILLHVVGDLTAQMGDYSALIGPLARLAGRAFETFTSLMARRALTIAQGEALAQRYSSGRRPVVNLMESTIGHDDIWVRESIALHDPIRLLYVGALLEKKGVHLLVEAVAHLSAEMNVVLALVGDGPMREALRALAIRLGIVERVQFVGSVGFDLDLQKQYRAADVFVMPSSAEGVPRVLLESMAHNLPVVATAVGGVPGLIRSGWNGVLVEAGSVPALCAGVRSVVDDESLRRQLITNARQTARCHTRQTHAAELMRLLGEYLEEHRSDNRSSLLRRPQA